MHPSAFNFSKISRSKFHFLLLIMCGPGLFLFYLLNERHCWITQWLVCRSALYIFSLGSIWCYFWSGWVVGTPYVVGPQMECQPGDWIFWGSWWIFTVTVDECSVSTTFCAIHCSLTFRHRNYFFNFSTPV